MTAAREENAEADALADAFIEDLRSESVPRRQQLRAVKRVIVSIVADWTEDERVALAEELSTIDEKANVLTPSVGEAANA